MGAAFEALVTFRPSSASQSLPLLMVYNANLISSQKNRNTMQFLLGLVAGIVLTLLVPRFFGRSPAAAQTAPVAEPEAAQTDTPDTAQSTDAEELPAKRDVVVGSANNGRSNKSNGVTDKKTPSVTTTSK